MNYEDLDVFKEAHGLVLDVYKLTKEFPKNELFGLASPCVILQPVCVRLARTGRLDGWL
jgi:hypothetical protein